MIDEQTGKTPSSFWRELPILLGVAILVAVLVRTFLLQTFYIPSGSMEHTLDLNDRVLVNKLVHDLRSPERGEIIVFKAPLEWRNNPNEEDFIKRVIGVGGDRIRCCDQGHLTVNGQPLDEPYIYSKDGRRDPAASRNFDVVVPDGRLWVMGDHRSSSGDSLQNWANNNEDIMMATVPEDAVIGRAFTIFWPVDRATWLSVPDTFESVPAPVG